MSKNVLLILFLCLFVHANVYAQDKVEETIDGGADEVELIEDVPSDEETKFEQIKLDRLKRIRNELVSLRSKINQTKKKLKQEDLDMVSKIQEESRLNSFQKEYAKKRFLFVETATSINLNQEEKAQEKADFFKDLQEILSPALNTFKQLSNKPRQIQELEERSKFLENKHEESKLALKRLEGLLKENKHKELKWKIKESIEITKKLEKELKIKREDLKFKILKMEKDQAPFITTLSNVVLDFFKTKGLNLFLALFAFGIVYWLFAIGKGRFVSVILFRINRSDNREAYQWIIRPIRVIYSLIAFTFAFFLGILTLYALNDWVLVTLILFVLFALVWSSKEYIPIIFEQSKIVLNLGSIREDERVLFNGIPWQIKSLGYYCRLYNPVLSGGFLRVNTRDIMHLCSRRIIDGEPWFPTKTGDWLEVSGVFGQVILQSPEQVIVKKLGGENLIYKASEFYSLTPLNLSQGFAIEFVFGVDYSHQSIIFTEVIPNFQEGISKALEKRYPDLKESFSNLGVEFISAGASSLDLRFFVKCKGSAASKKLLLMRGIQAEFVQICNEHDYIIPFNQLTVHMEKM